MYSTHDWEQQAPPSNNWSEAWSDVKTPGDGRTYAVGTTMAGHTDAASFFVTFSGVGGTGPGSLTQGRTGGFSDAATKVVAILQVTNAQGVIQWQRFFHGDGGALSPGTITSTHARGISVFPAATTVDTRIVICGDTYDQRLELGGQESGLQSEAAGFVAVYDGDGRLLWTHLFYGLDPFASTVVTDVSIHVDTRVTPPIDVVTYCGLSTNGVYNPNHPAPAPPTPLTPKNYFAAPPQGTGCSANPDGNPVNHPSADPSLSSGQWDGIVGRLVKNHSGTGPVTQRFHAIVGGGLGDDALFGITEKDWDVFAVVGTTKTAYQPNVNTSFPLTHPSWSGGPICLATTPGYVHGVLVECNAGPTAQNQPLQLLGSTLIGAPGAATVARDVLGHGWKGVGLYPGHYYVVGSTTDPAFTAGFPGPVLGDHHPLATGFLVASEGPQQGFTHASYWPKKEDPEAVASGAVGLGAWSEHFDHVSVSGWVQAAANGPKDLVVSSLFLDTVGPPGTEHLDLVRQVTMGAPGDEFAAAIDSILFPTPFLGQGHAPSFSYPAGVGEPCGGGIAVDSRGRQTLVGSTLGVPGYPVTTTTVPAGRTASTALGTNSSDAVRSVIDMLPAGVCRSDGTGQCPTPWSPTGNGGTTPACALSPFGNVPGVTPALRRMFLDYEGEAGPGQPVSLIVDRPPDESWVVLSGWQLGIPSSTPEPQLLFDHDVEIWVAGAGYIGALPATGGSIREDWGLVPPSGATYSCQYVCLLIQPMTGTSCTAPDLTWAATPALYFSH